MGYGSSSIGYRIWNPITRSIMVRRDVKFFENESLGNHSGIRSEEKNQGGIDLTVDLNSQKVLTPPTSSEDQRVSEDTGTKGLEVLPRRSERTRREPAKLTYNRLGEANYAYCYLSEVIS